MVSRQNSSEAKQNNCSTTVRLATLLLLTVCVHIVFLAFVRQSSFQSLPHKHRLSVRRLAVTAAVQPGLPRNAKLLVVQAFIVQGARAPLSRHYFSRLEWTDCPAANHNSSISSRPAANSSDNSHGTLGDRLSGGCQQGMLTSHGYQTSFNIGAYLRQQYIGRYTLLPPHYNRNSVLATSNAQQATIDTLHTVVAALYPNASNVGVQLNRPGNTPGKGSSSGIAGTTCHKLVQLQRKLQQLQESKGGSTNSAEWQLLATRIHDLLLGLNWAINNITSAPGPASPAADTFASAANLASSVLQSVWRSTSSLHNPRSHLHPFGSRLDILHDTFAEVWQHGLPGRQLLQQSGSSTSSPAVVQVPQQPQQAAPATPKASPAVIKSPQPPHQTEPAIPRTSPAVIKAPQQPHQTVPASSKATPAVIKLPQQPHQTKSAGPKASPAVIKVPEGPHQTESAGPKASPAVIKSPQPPHQAVPTSPKASAAVIKVPQGPHQTKSAGPKAPPAVIKVPQQPHQTKSAGPKASPAVIKVPQQPHQTKSAGPKAPPAVIKVPQQPHQTKSAGPKASPAVIKVPQQPHQTKSAGPKASPAVIKVPQQPHQTKSAGPKTSPAVIKVPQQPHQTKSAGPKASPAVIKVPQQPPQAVPASPKASPAVVKVPQGPHQKKSAGPKEPPAVIKVPQQPHQTKSAGPKASPAVVKAPQQHHQAVHSLGKGSSYVSKEPVRRQQAVHTNRSSSASSNPRRSIRLAADNSLWDHFLDELACIAGRGDASISSKARDVLFYLEPWMLRNKLAIVAPGPKDCLSTRADCEQVQKLGVGRLAHEILLQWQAAVTTVELKNDHRGVTCRPGTEQTSQCNPRPLSWSDVMHIADPMQQPKLLLHGVEDKTLAVLLRAVGVQPAAWPPFSSHLELELWQHSVPNRNTSASVPHYFVRIMYQGLPILFTKRGTQLQGKLPYASRHADSSDSQLQERDFICAYNSASDGVRKCHNSNKAAGLPVVSLEEVKALALGRLALDSKQYTVACGGGSTAAAMG